MLLDIKKADIQQYSIPVFSPLVPVHCRMSQGPEVWTLLDRIKEVVRPYGVQLLCEVHEDFLLSIELAR
jgi:hypothetical protein